MWCLGTWLSGGLGSVRLTVGLDDLKGLFQPKQFYDSKLHHRNNASTAKEETAPSLFAPMPSRQHTRAFTTTTTLFPPRTSHSDAQHVPAAKATPKPGVTTWVTANKHKRQAANPQSWVCTAAATHLGRLPFLHLPALASM